MQEHRPHLHPEADLAALAGAAALSLSGCNTVSGAGKDLQESSDATKKAITGEGKSTAK